MKVELSQSIVEYSINYTFISVEGNSDSRLSRRSVENRSSLLQKTCIIVCILNHKSANQFLRYTIITSETVVAQNYLNTEILPIFRSAFDSNI